MWGLPAWGGSSAVVPKHPRSDGTSLSFVSIVQPPCFRSCCFVGGGRRPTSPSPPILLLAIAPVALALVLQYLQDDDGLARFHLFRSNGCIGLGLDASLSFLVRSVVVGGAPTAGVVVCKEKR